MSVELHYRKEASALFGSIWRPVAEVLLEGPNGRFTDLFYIDSGADITLIPDEVGIIIGLERKDIQLTQLTGVGGRSIRVHEVKIPLTIGEYIFRSEEAWAIRNHVPLLLGRTGVFDQFKVEFDQKALITRFNKYENRNL